ncbi:hypothetical protein C0995_010942 [Termitomyces sp. Mi166|nr:hypothetical protein C0995_010942 [Termitomyces sp. Mi166\
MSIHRTLHRPLPLLKLDLARWNGSSPDSSPSTSGPPSPLPRSELDSFYWNGSSPPSSPPNSTPPSPNFLPLSPVKSIENALKSMHLHPEPGSSSPTALLPNPDMSITSLVLKRCDSDSFITAKADPHLRSIEVHDGTKTAVLSETKMSSHTLTEDHLDMVFKERYNRLVCQMCILEQTKLDKEKAQFIVASFDIDEPALGRYTHCFGRHPNETEEMTKIPPPMLLENLITKYLCTR